MKKILVQLGMVVSVIAAIAPAVSAQSISNGDYSDVYGGSYVIQVRNNKFTVLYDDPSPSEPWKSVSKAGFKPIKYGVFYNTYNRTYYCLSNNSIDKSMSKRRTPARCTRNGWR
jgi:hypothetical protein